MRPLYTAKQSDGNGVREKVDPSLTPDADGVNSGLIPGGNKAANGERKMKSIQGQNQSTLPTISAAYVSKCLTIL